MIRGRGGACAAFFCSAGRVCAGAVSVFDRPVMSRVAEIICRRSYAVRDGRRVESGGLVVREKETGRGGAAQRPAACYVFGGGGGIKYRVCSGDGYL